MTVVTEQQSGDTKHHQIRQDIQRYIDEVFDLEYDLSKFKFPEKDGFPAYMVGGLPISVDEVMIDLASFFKVEAQVFLNVAVIDSLIRDRSQKRPYDLYVFAHSGSSEPDVKYENKSFNEIVLENLQFMDPSEYFLCSGFQMWKHKKWMDMKGRAVKGGTMTSSTWSNGRFVGGRFDHTQGISLDAYTCDDGAHSYAPREIFLG